MKTYAPATGGRYSFITRNQYNWQRKLVSGLKEDKVFQTILNTLQVCDSFVMIITVLLTHLILPQLLSFQAHRCMT